MNPISSSRSTTDTDFDEKGVFVPEHVPDPGPFLEGHDVLEGEAHVAVHAIDADDSSVLRAEFNPTTAFCPQAGALIKGSFRAWNGLSDRYQYDLVSVRVGQAHHQAESLNEALEERYLETGVVPSESTGRGSAPPLEPEREGDGDETSGRFPF